MAGPRRSDEVERTTISAHVDKELVEYLEDQRLSKSEWVEKGLRLVLEQTMNEDQLAHKLKMEAKKQEEKIQQAQRRLDEIDKKAKETLGTTLDDYMEENDPKDIHDQRKEQFIDGWLADYASRNDTIDETRVATYVFDTILEREFGLTGQAAIDFVKDCVQDMGINENSTSNAPNQSSL